MNQQSSKTTTFVVSDLCCAAEEQTIRKKLEGRSDVQSLNFNLISHTLRVQHSTSDQEISKLLNDAGFASTVVQPTATLTSVSLPSTKPHSPILFSTVISGVLLLAGGAFSWLDLPEGVATTCFILSIMVGGWKIGLKAAKAVRNLSLDMNFLMALAAIGAIAIGEHAEGAAVIFLFALSLLLESMSVERSRRAIQSLMKLSPISARVRRDTTEEEVPVDQVAIGETIVIRPGERIPLDGTIIAGSSTIDESSITGESLPVSKHPHATVFAGTFNQRGSLEIATTKLSSDSTLSRIIHLIEEAQSKKAPSQSFVEVFARYYTPAVFFLAIAVAVIPPFFFGLEFNEWFYRALVLLVIACPCALVISTPITIVSALTNAARHGILVKGGRYLEHLAVVRAVALDKTGTLTQGKPEVTDIVPLNSVSTHDLLKVAAAIENKSEHHLADAFMRKAEEEGISVGDVTVEHFRALTGRGVQGTIAGRTYVLGNHQLVEELGLCSSELEKILLQLESGGKTAVALAQDKSIIGVIGISDPLRSNSKDAISALRSLGVDHIVMLTGDNRGTAKALAEEVNLNEIQAELLPEQKLSLINSLKERYGIVAMVGDGVNDAPALAAADIGIAMGGAGSDTALETADVVLMKDDLSKLPYAIRLGKKAAATIKQNIAIALTTKAIFLVLGVLGLTSLWLAILADDGATLVVILNSLRLLRSK